MPRTTPSIPRDALRAGIEHCLRSALRYLNGARSLSVVEPPTGLPQASILFSFAVEEFGKAVLLRRAYEQGEAMPAINGFYDHKPKLGAAFAEIPADFVMLHVWAFQTDTSQADAFDVDRVADFEARMQSMYVGWDERSRTWVGPTDVDKPMLVKNIDDVERFIKGKLEEWVWIGE